MGEDTMVEDKTVYRGGHLGGRGRWIQAALAAGLVLSAVAPAFADDDEPGWTDRISQSLKNGIGSATKAVGLGKPAAPPSKEAPSGCPTIAILDGTSAQRVMAPGASGNEGLRYQYSLNSVGRECSSSGSAMSVKIGANGRVLLGPAGSSGHFDVPIRVVIISQLDGKPVESKLYRVAVNLTANQPSVPFDFVSDQIRVPVGAGRTGDDYAIRVGIDGGAKTGDVAKVMKVRHRKQSKTAESASQ